MDDVTKTDKMLARKDGGVGYLIFNNPERHNAVSLEMWNATSRILDDFAKDSNIRVRRRRPAPAARHSCPAPTSPSSRASARRKDAQRIYNETVERAYTSIHDFPKPTIAMIRGYCIGGGLGLAVCCDLRICSDNSKFAVPAAKLGLGYGYQGLQAADRCRRPGLRQGDLLHRAAVRHRRKRCRWASSIACCRVTELESYVKNYADTMAGNAPLTVTGGQVHRRRSHEGREQARPAEMRRHGRRLLRQQGLSSRAGRRFHGKAQAGVHRHVISRQRESRQRHGPDGRTAEVGRADLLQLRRRGQAESAERHNDENNRRRATVALRGRRKRRGVG